MKANEGHYITVAKNGANGWLVTSKTETETLLETHNYRACVILNEATGSLVKTKGSISGEMWNVVEGIRMKRRFGLKSRLR